MFDKTILHKLFCQYYSEMNHLARTLLYADEEAEDVVQDVFLRLMEKDILPSDDKVKTYLMTAVRNGCINRIKRKNLTEQIRNLYSIEAETDLLFVEERLATLDAVCEDGLTATDYARNRHMTLPQSTWYLNNTNVVANLDGTKAMLQ